MHVSLLHRMDEADFVGVEADSAVRVGPLCPILEVSLDDAAYA